MTIESNTQALLPPPQTPRESEYYAMLFACLRASQAKWDQLRKEATSMKVVFSSKVKDTWRLKEDLIAY